MSLLIVLTFALCVIEIYLKKNFWMILLCKVNILLCYAQYNEIIKNLGKYVNQKMVLQLIEFVKLE